MQHVGHAFDASTRSPDLLRPVVFCLRLGKIGTRQNQLCIEFGKLLLGDRQPVRFFQPVLSAVDGDRAFRIHDLLAQISKTA